MEGGSEPSVNTVEGKCFPRMNLGLPISIFKRPIESKHDAYQCGCHKIWKMFRSWS